MSKSQKCIVDDKMKKYLFIVLVGMALLLSTVSIKASSIVTYDVNGNGVIEKNEAVQAASDFLNGVTTKQVSMDVIIAYFSASPSLSTEALSTGSVTRSFSTANPAAGAAMTVTLTPGGVVAQMFYQVIETLPPGFTYVSTTADHANQTGQIITFTMLTGTAFTYTVTAPATDGTFTFSGTFKDNNRDTGAVTGAAQVTVGNPTPAAIAQPAPTGFVYSAKFVCGVSDGGPVVKGTYATAINVHNPQKPVFNPAIGPFLQEIPLIINKKVVLANPESMPLGSRSKLNPFRLPSDSAFEIDCADIATILQQSQIIMPPFAKGFVVINSTKELDVVAVYTAGGASVESIDVETIIPKKIL